MREAPEGAEPRSSRREAISIGGKPDPGVEGSSVYI